ACFQDELDNVVDDEDGGWIFFLGGSYSSGTKKYQGSNSGDGGNSEDGVKITGGVIGFGGGIGFLKFGFYFIKISCETVSAAAVIPSAVPETISAAAIPSITAPPIQVAAPVKADVASTRRKRGVVIWDPEEESSAKNPNETTSKDKGKGILVEEPKPMKKKQQVELDEAYARKLQEEFNQDIDLEAAIDHVKQKAKEEPLIQRYQNTAGFTLDYFKGTSYDDIRLIFVAKFNAYMEFLLKSKEQIEEEESRAIAINNETPAQKAAKRRKFIKEAKEAEIIKQHLQLVLDEDDDVFTEATPLARKVPVMDYHVILVNNKP
nr:hypothetical protein [Tanacetum cinerariifolium]